jgi:uncharacterized protein
MSTSTSDSPEARPVIRTPWWGIVFAMLLYLAPILFFPALKQIMAVPLILYLVIESRLRHHSWAENGFKYRDLFSGFRATLGWFLLVAFGSQVLAIYGEHFFLPAVSGHILARVPYDLSTLNAGIFIFLAVSTFLEELIFRVLFQNRLSSTFSPVVSIGLVSFVFIVAHYTPGPALVVFFDLLGVFIDSLIFGVIFQRTKNVFVVWIAHYIADVVALLMLLSLK